MPGDDWSEGEDEEEHEYEVGFRKPPREHRFQKGCSGNPAGRKRGNPNHNTLVRRVAQTRHPIARRGRVQKITNLELVLEIVRKMAAKGDCRALELIEHFTATPAGNPYEPRVKDTFFCPEKLTIEEWIARYELQD